MFSAFLTFLLLCSVTTLHQAQRSNFANLEGHSNFLNILPTAELGAASLRESFDEGNVQRVVSILQGNIRQWSFIESQLLEPNVNLDLPEIFIPLKHLTTTLEVLGNIFVVRGDFEDAKVCLERACPLMELLPHSLVEQVDHPLDESSTTARGNYANECFSMLRKVYAHLYGDGNRSSDATSIAADVSEDIALEGSRSSFDVDRHIEFLRGPFRHLRDEFLRATNDVGASQDTVGHSDPCSHEDINDCWDVENVDQEGFPFANSRVNKPSPSFESPFHVEEEYDGDDDDDDPLVFRLGGNSIAVVATDLETLLVRFVKAEREFDVTTENELVRLAIKYADELDAHFPDLSVTEYSCNMAMVIAVIDVLRQSIKDKQYAEREVNRLRRAHEESVDNLFSVSQADRNSLFAATALENVRADRDVDVAFGLSLAILDNDRAQTIYPERVRRNNRPIDNVPFPRSSISSSNQFATHMEQSKESKSQRKERRRRERTDSTFNIDLYESHDSPQISGSSSPNQNEPAASGENDWVLRAVASCVVLTVVALGALHWHEQQNVDSSKRKTGRKDTSCSENVNRDSINKKITCSDRDLPFNKEVRKFEKDTPDDRRKDKKKERERKLSTPQSTRRERDNADQDQGSRDLLVGRSDLELFSLDHDSLVDQDICVDSPDLPSQVEKEMIPVANELENPCVDVNIVDMSPLIAQPLSITAQPERVLTDSVPLSNTVADEVDYLTAATSVTKESSPIRFDVVVVVSPKKPTPLSPSRSSAGSKHRDKEKSSVIKTTHVDSEIARGKFANNKVKGTTTDQNRLRVSTRTSLQSNAEIPRADIPSMGSETKETHVFDVNTLTEVSLPSSSCDIFKLENDDLTSDSLLASSLPESISWSSNHEPSLLFSPRPAVQLTQPSFLQPLSTPFASNISTPPGLLSLNLPALSSLEKHSRTESQDNNTNSYLSSLDEPFSLAMNFGDSLLGLGLTGESGLTSSTQRNWLSIVDGDIDSEENSRLLHTVLDDILTPKTLSSLEPFCLAQDVQASNKVETTPLKVGDQSNQHMVSDLSPHAPVFLPSNLLFSPTPDPFSESNDKWKSKLS